MEYKIIYTTIDGIKLTYHIDSYEVVNGALIRFTDKKMNEVKLLPLTNVEIRENDNDGKFRHIR